MRVAAAAAGALLAAALTPPAAGDSPIRLREAAGAWGVDFRHHHGGSGERYMVETMCGGVALFDYDSDGDTDLLFVDGGRLPGYRGEPPRSRLFRNDGGRFTDVTGTAGIEAASYGCGAVAADIEGDGDLDLYLSQFGPNQLFRNDGDGTFTDVTAAAGVADPLWSMGTVFSDVDRDGDLDLYVANYVDFSLDNHKFCGDEKRGLQGYCHPGAYDGVPDTFYRNNGDGTFRNDTAAAGFPVDEGAGLGVIAGDLDNDGWPDLYVANDSTPNFLYRNRGDGTFEDLALLSGVAYGDRGKPEAGMGVDLADLDGNGYFDLVVTNFELETNALYSNMGNGLFIDSRYTSKMGEPTLIKLAFGVVFADLDLDGDEDLVIGNGHTLDNAAEFDARSRYAQENQVFENLGGGTFRELGGHGMDSVRVTRALAAGDLDDDGDLDLVAVNSNDVAELFENVTEPAGGWLQVELRQPAGNRFGLDARVELVGGGRRQLREVRTGVSYLSQNALPLVYGLGGDAEADELRIRWPSGPRQVIREPPARRRLVVHRASRMAAPPPG